jgi:hypothetical protein
MGMTKRNARSEIGEQPPIIKRIGPLKLALGALALLMVSGVLAQSGGSFVLDPGVVAGGGAISSSGGTYTLGSTVGQTGAGITSGGGFTIYSGFWNPVAEGGPIYVPMVLRSPPPPTPPPPTPTTSICPERESNDTPKLSQPLPTNNGSCIGTFENEPAGDTFDYYSIQVSQGQRIVVKLTDIPAGANYDIALQRENGPDDYTTVDTSANLGQADELIDHVAQSSNRHFIRVKVMAKSPSATDNYILSVAIN